MLSPIGIKLRSKICSKQYYLQAMLLLGIRKKVKSRHREV